MTNFNLFFYFYFFQMTNFNLKQTRTDDLIKSIFATGLTQYNLQFSLQSAKV